eukprot:440798-Hanusia_phi.AAC.10
MSGSKRVENMPREREHIRGGECRLAGGDGRQDVQTHRSYVEEFADFPGDISISCNVALEIVLRKVR